MQKLNKPLRCLKSWIIKGHTCVRKNECTIQKPLDNWNVNVFIISPIKLGCFYDNENHVGTGAYKQLNQVLVSAQTSWSFLFLSVFLSDPLIHLPQHKRMGNERLVFTYQSLTFGAKNSSAGKFMRPKSEKLEAS